MMFRKIYKSTILFKIIFIAILTHQTVFAECFYDCCICCDCCYSDKITDEDGAMTENILKHLKLDNGELNDIAVEINNIQNNEEKIKKIIEYTKDIDWKNECCPNTLIKWENNECAYIAYFDLMLNNPYFLKFFLICNDTMRREDTYVLNAICECVKWCIYHPSFNKNNMGSVDKIMKAFFRKEGKEYYYLKKEISFSQNKPERQKEEPLLKIYYYGVKDTTGKYVNVKPHVYGGFQGGTIFNNTLICLLYDLQIKGTDLEKEIWQLFPEPADEKNFNKENIAKIFSSKEEDQLPILKTHKLLGAMLYQLEWHAFSLINNNGIWYNKNTLHKKQCKKMTVHEVFKLFNEILKIKKPTYKQFNKGHCNFLFIKKNQKSL